MFKKWALWRSTRGRYSAASPCGPKPHGSRLSLGSAWWPGGLYGCPRWERGALQNGQMCVFVSQRVGIKGTVGGWMRAGTRVGLDSPGRQDGLGPTGRPGRQPGPPGATRRARERDKSEAGKARRCPRGEAAVLKRLSVQTPEGVLKSGYPGSDGEPGCGFSWLPAWHPGGGPRLPGSPRRARQYGSFAVRT